MASNPYFSPLHTQRFSFIGSPQQRDGTYQKDQRFLNMYPELIKSPISDGKKYYLKKRPGLTNFLQFTPGEGRGIHYWPINGVLYTCIGNTLYGNDLAILTLATSQGNVGFCEYRNTTSSLLILCDGVNGYYIDVNSLPTRITDPNFPSPHIPAPVFMDGYLLLARGASDVICNSALGDPTVWPSDGFISAEMYPDNISTLLINLNYVVAIGTGSVEFLYDNANATGSPLQRNAPAVSQIGCPAPLTANQTEKEFIMVGDTANGGRTIWLFDGFQPTEIANEPVREALDLEFSAISAASAFTVQVSGHKFYVLNLIQSSRTFVYDFEEQMWHEWTSGPGQQVFLYKFATNSGFGEPTLLGYQTGNVANLNTNPFDLTLDTAGQIVCQVVTTKIDFDTIARKRYFRLSLATDAPDQDVDIIMTVDWSDDDYNTWVGNRSLNLNDEYPTITQLGISRRRAFRFTFAQPFALRMESFEVDITQEVRR